MKSILFGRVGADEEILNLMIRKVSLSIAILHLKFPSGWMLHESKAIEDYLKSSKLNRYTVNEDPASQFILPCITDWERDSSGKLLNKIIIHSRLVKEYFMDF